MTSKTNYQMNTMNTKQNIRVGCTDGGPDLESPSRKKRKINVNKNRKKGQEIRGAGAARGCDADCRSFYRWGGGEKHVKEWQNPGSLKNHSLGKDRQIDGQTSRLQESHANYLENNSRNLACSCDWLERFSARQGLRSRAVCTARSSLSESKSNDFHVKISPPVCQYHYASGNGGGGGGRKIHQRLPSASLILSCDDKV